LVQVAGGGDLSSCCLINWIVLLDHCATGVLRRRGGRKEESEGGREEGRKGGREGGGNETRGAIHGKERGRDGGDTLRASVTI